MAPSLRKQRLRWVWVLAPPFFLLARPSLLTLMAGGLIALPGLFLRGAASGFILKDQSLARHGPYAHLRHPLYAGSFLAGLGMAVASGRWMLVGSFLLLFSWIYLRTIRAEEAQLEARFGDAFRTYRRQVPAFLPGLSGRRNAPAEAPGPGAPWMAASAHLLPEAPRRFQLRLFRRNRGWEATLGVAACLFFLWLRMWYLA